MEKFDYYSFDLRSVPIMMTAYNEVQCSLCSSKVEHPLVKTIPAYHRHLIDHSHLIRKDERLPGGLYSKTTGKIICPDCLKDDVQVEN